MHIEHFILEYFISLSKLLDKDIVSIVSIEDLYFVCILLIFIIKIQIYDSFLLTLEDLISKNILTESSKYIVEDFIDLICECNSVNLKNQYVNNLLCQNPKISYVCTSTLFYDKKTIETIGIRDYYNIYFNKFSER